MSAGMIRVAVGVVASDDPNPQRGATHMQATTQPSDAARLLARLNFDGPTPAHAPELGACHEWTGYRDPSGYGQLTIRRGHISAHRLAWELENGPLPKGKCVLHRCDNPPCARGSHLFAGTRVENNADRDTKRRGDWHSAEGLRKRCERMRGEVHPRALITEADARAVLASPETGRVWAKRLNVTESTISRLRRRKNWKHIA